MRRLRLFSGVLLALTALPAWAAPVRTGQEIYRAQCVKCHGPSGQGVAGKADEALHGNRSLESLTQVIRKTMPEDKPETLSVADAGSVAAYIYDAFYSPAARGRLQPARIDFSRLTVEQHRNALADLLAGFREPAGAGDERGGLRAVYYSAKNFAQDKKAMERVDPKIDFDFAAGSPDAKIAPEEFSVRWRGSFIATETGEYEFVLKSQNGVRLWVNSDGKPTIDEWVSSGAEPREHRASVFLLAGRVYPLQLDFFKFKEKTASVRLQWKTPGGVAAPISGKDLSPRRVAETLVIRTPFPADDASIGYERGVSVSKAWERATTAAAIETANYVSERLDELSRSKPGAADRVQKLKDFCAVFIERAFRRPLSAEDRAFFVDAVFKDTEPELAVKRVVLLALKSPRFLYPELTSAKPDSYDVATRLSLGLWDSIPDRVLLDAAARGKLRTRQEIAEQARRMLADPRARAKLRGFFHHWLEMDKGTDISKDAKSFPDFSEQVLADMRTSLDLFLDAVAWGKEADYRRLLLSERMYVNERLAKFIGVEGPTGEEFQEVSLDPTQRSGVITHPYLLSALAYHKNSSPIHRGVFVTRNIVGRALKPPPMAIEFMDNRFDPTLTMREKVTELTRPAGCMSCHEVINPLGFALENFDAVGRFRTTDNNKNVDPTGQYQTPDGKTVRLTGARDLAEHAAGSPDAHLAFLQQLFQHVAKQSPAAFGPATAENLRKRFEASQFNIQEMLVEIAAMAAMRGLE